VVHQSKHLKTAVVIGRAISNVKSHLIFWQQPQAARLCTENACHHISWLWHGNLMEIQIDRRHMVAHPKNRESRACHCSKHKPLCKLFRPFDPMKLPNSRDMLKELGFIAITRLHSSCFRCFKFLSFSLESSAFQLKKKKAEELQLAVGARYGST
jgi:hypothetical protein